MNSKVGFIAKLLLGFLGSLGLYASLIQFLPFKPEYGETLQDANKIQIESYLFSNQKNIGIVVGSSLVARLPHDELLPEIYNLGMRGHSALTGLDVLVRSHYSPPVVFIEINTLHIGKSDSLPEAIFAFPNYQAKTYIPSLRTQYQPANVWHSALIELNNARQDSPRENGNSNNVPNHALFQKLLAETQTRMAVPPDTKQLQQNVSDLREALDILEQRGSIPIFIEMPIHQTLVNSPRQEMIRESIQTVFPSSQYHYIYPLRDEHISTTDGIHLDFSSSIKVTEILRVELQENISQLDNSLVN